MPIESAEFEGVMFQRENVVMGSVRSELAPDGLPWPKGYFDAPPKWTLEEAIAEYGVRPSEYLKGWPVYTEEDARKPEFKCALQLEPPEVEAYYDKLYADSEGAADEMDGG